MNYRHFSIVLQNKFPKKMKTATHIRRLQILVACFSLFSATSLAQTGTWSGQLEVQGTRLAIVFHLDGDKPTMDSPDQGVRGIPILIERKDFGGISIDIPSIAATYTANLLFNKLMGTFTQSGISLPLTLAPGEQKLRRPQTPVEPFPYSSEEVTFQNSDVTLHGTLVLPEGCSRATPVLLMVTGSGQQNRDEELFEHKPFAVIADALARAGIATLRYDDRGISGYAGNIGNCTTEDFKNDAAAGIELLRGRFDNVGVIGHSEGGTIALMLAAEKKVDFVVSLAGMIVSGAQTLVWQNRVSLKALGFADAEVEAYCQLLEKAFAASVQGGPLPDSDACGLLPESLKKNYQAVLEQIRLPYLHHFLELDLRPLLGSINCPVLALNGSKDSQVDPDGNLAALRSGLPNTGTNKIEVLPGLNHIFQHCTTGSASEYRDIEETFAPEALDKIISWVSELYQ